MAAALDGGLEKLIMGELISIKQKIHRREE